MIEQSFIFICFSFFEIKKKKNELFVLNCQRLKSCFFMLSNNNIT